MKKIIIQGSSRSKGNTNKIVELLRSKIDSELIDLSHYNISHYDYEHKNNDDDFMKLMKQITQYDVIIFATPVYWYSMSGLMKMFFDRITDCLKIEKELGRKLKGKCMATISCGSEEREIDGFFVPFRNSAKYLEMTYLGDMHTWIEEDCPTEKVLRLVSEFALKMGKENTVHNKV